MTQYEILKKDSNGNRLLIRIYFMDGVLRIQDVGFTPKGKRNVTYIASALRDDYSWRALGAKERREAQAYEILKYTSEELLLEALEEVWISLKPSELKF
ncbi:hypothetical protein DOE78_18975 [Bacillus sp. Y1]|nr:hypothetical protein DOE78_18975 [Bacillus sp. Y1]